MILIFKTDFDADLFNLDRKAVRGVVSIRVSNNCPCRGKSSVFILK